MPIVHIYILEGRTKEQKRELVRNVTDAIKRAINPKHRISIILHELPSDNFAEEAVLYSDEK